MNPNDYRVPKGSGTKGTASRFQKVPSPVGAGTRNQELDPRSNEQSQATNPSARRKAEARASRKTPPSAVQHRGAAPSSAWAAAPARSEDHAASVERLRGKPLSTGSASRPPSIETSMIPGRFEAGCQRFSTEVSALTRKPATSHAPARGAR